MIEQVEPPKIYVHDWVDDICRDNYSRKIAITAGYGTSKSYGSWQWLLHKMKQNPKCKEFFYAEPTYNLVKKIAIPKFYEVAESYGLQYKRDYTVITGVNPMIIFHTRRQIIWLLSLDKPESQIGFEVGAGVIDEAANCKTEARRKVNNRFRAKGMVGAYQLLEVTTPEGLGDFSDEYNSDELPGWKFTKENDAYSIQVQHTLKGKRHVIRRRIRLSTYINEKFLPDNYIADLYSDYGHNENYIDSYVFGYFRPFSSGLAYSAYKGALHKIPKIEASPHLPLNLSFDFNIEPQWVVIQEHEDKEESIFYEKPKKFNAVIEESNHGHELLEDSICQEFVEKFPPYRFARTPIRIYGDPTGHHGSHKAGKDFSRIKKWLNDIGYANVTILAPDSAPLERVSVDNVNRDFSENILKICENCEKTLKSVIRTVWARGERKKLDKPQKDTWTHPMDAVKYFISAIKVVKRLI